ncbi:MAG: AraC family transcriptional regulator [Bifidobacteriaceae bacterium]|jgi:AraC-like DNA-binding protein|nr:AraC family transcriptional regulator [Bifidobacteriaceae bacterium]
MAREKHNLGLLTGLDLTEELLELLDELPGVMFCVKDASGRYVAVNPAFVRRSSARSEREALGRTAGELFVPELAERYEHQDSEVLASGRALRGQLEIIRHPEGRPGWYVTTKLPLVRDPGAGPRAIAVIAISTDLRSAAADDVTYHGLARVVELVRTRLAAEPSRAPASTEMAAAAGCSVSTLDRHMRRVFGLSPRQFVLKQRMDRAMTLLSTTDLPIATVAEQAGFYDQPAFTRQLARLIGETPAQFRRRSRAA